MQINDSKHENLRSSDSVEHPIGEPTRDRSPHLPIHDLVLHRVQTNAVEKGIDLLHELAAEADALPLVPSGGGPDIRLCLPPDNQSVGHKSRRRSSRAVSQGSTSVGISSCCRIRSSSSRRCASLNGRCSISLATSSHSSSTRRTRSSAGSMRKASTICWVSILASPLITTVLPTSSEVHQALKARHARRMVAPSLNQARGRRLGSSCGQCRRLPCPEALSPIREPRGLMEATMPRASSLRCVISATAIFASAATREMSL